LRIKFHSIIASDIFLDILIQFISFFSEMTQISRIFYSPQLTGGDRHSRNASCQTVTIRNGG
jgi:hypothetical protein